MKDLIKQIEYFQNLGELEDNVLDKIKLNDFIDIGKSVRVVWKDGTEDDYGYTFSLPTQEYDEYDFCIHIPSEEVWMHVYEVASLPNVKEIIVSEWKN